MDCIGMKIGAVGFQIGEIKIWIENGVNHRSDKIQNGEKLNLILWLICNQTLITKIYMLKGMGLKTLDIVTLVKSRISPYLNSFLRKSTFEFYC